MCAIRPPPRANHGCTGTAPPAGPRHIPHQARPGSLRAPALAPAPNLLVKRALPVKDTVTASTDPPPPSPCGGERRGGGRGPRWWRLCALGGQVVEEGRGGCHRLAQNGARPSPCRARPAHHRGGRPSARPSLCLFAPSPSATLCRHTHATPPSPRLPLQPLTLRPPALALPPHPAAPFSRLPAPHPPLLRARARTTRPQAGGPASRRPVRVCRACTLPPPPAPPRLRLLWQAPPPLGVVDAPVGVAASQCPVPLFFFFSLCSLFPRAVFRVAPPPALSPVPLRPCGSLTSLPVRRPLPAAAGGSGTHPVLSPFASRRPCVVAFAFPPSPCPTSRSLVARTFVPSRLLPCRYPLSYEPPPAPCPRTHPLSISTSETPPAPPPRSPPLPGPCLPSP